MPCHPTPLHSGWLVTPGKASTVRPPRRIFPVGFRRQQAAHPCRGCRSSIYFLLPQYTPDRLIPLVAAPIAPVGPKGVGIRSVPSNQNYRLPFGTTDRPPATPALFQRKVLLSSIPGIEQAPGPKNSRGNGINRVEESSEGSGRDRFGVDQELVYVYPVSRRLVRQSIGVVAADPNFGFRHQDAAHAVGASPVLSLHFPFDCQQY